MAGHRTFNVDRFLDRFVGRESLIRQYVGLFSGRSGVTDASTLDIPRFRQYLIDGSGSAKDELLEGLYRACDLCTERGHEDLIAACREYDYDPDPHGVLPVECLSLKVQTEHKDAFNLAYDRNALWQAERFSIYRGPEPREIEHLPAAAERLQMRLEDVFRQTKRSDRVLVRQYRENATIISSSTTSDAPRPNSCSNRRHRVGASRPSCCARPNRTSSATTARPGK